MSDTVRPLEENVDRLYRYRFKPDSLSKKAAVWKILCQDWFSRYVPAHGAVLDVGAGYCEFINHIQAQRRVAVDLNPETGRHAAPEVEVHMVAAEDMGQVLAPGSIDTAFTSNFLEHCRSRDQLLAVLRAVATVLRPGGRFLILGPNFRCCYKVYYDFFDHHLALTEKSVVEALVLAEFDIEEVHPQTLPYTFRSRLPSWPWLVRLYLRMPFAWKLLGAHFFIVARCPASPPTDG